MTATMKSFLGCSRKPWVPSTCASDLRKLLSVPLRSQGHCGVGRGLSELHWVWCNGRGPHDKLRQEPQGSSPGFECAGSDSDRRVPAELGQESQASSCLRKGTPLASRVAQGVSGPSSSGVWNPRVFADDARGWQCPFVLCLHPQGCLRRGVRTSGPSQERTGESGAFGMCHHPRGWFKFPLEYGLILRCAGKAGNPFQTTQGYRLSCRVPEGRRVSDEAVLGHSVFPSREHGVSGNFLGSQVGCQGPFHPSGRNMGLPLRRRRGQGPHLAKRWEPRGFSRVAAGFSSYDGDLSLPLGLALGSPIFPSGCEGKLGVALESLQGPRDLT